METPWDESSLSLVLLLHEATQFGKAGFTQWHPVSSPPARLFTGVLSLNGTAILNGTGLNRGEESKKCR
jgi:hypothetical protein